MPKSKDRTGERFGMLVIIDDDIGRNKHQQKLCRARCDCGEIWEGRVGALVTGNTTSCGCTNTMEMRRARIAKAGKRDKTGKNNQNFRHGGWVKRGGEFVDRDYVNEYHRNNRSKWHKKNPHKRKQYQRVRRNKKRANGGDFTEAEWQSQLRIQRNRCFACFEQFDLFRPPTVDHFVPVSNGGSGDIENIVAMCESCNKSKGNREFFEWFEWKFGEPPLKIA